MSNEALTWAWGKIREREVPRSLIPEFVAMADQANDQGVAWLLNSTLAAKTATTERTVQRNVARLARLGMIQIIERRQKGNQNRSNLYLLNMPGVDAKQRAHFVGEMTEGVIARERQVPRKASEGQETPEQGDTHDTPWVTPASPPGRHERHPLGDTGVTHNPQLEPSVRTIPEGIGEQDRPAAKKGKKKAAKGPARIPEDWRVPDSVKQKLINEGFQEQHIDAQAELFRIYWTERDDAKARKASWSLTFINWMKRAGKERAPEGAPAGSRKPTGEDYVRPQRNQQAKRGAALIGDLARGLYEDERGDEGPGTGELIEQ